MNPRLSCTLTVVLASCTGTPSDAPHIAVAMRPLSLSGVENACWSLTIDNGATPAATVVALDTLCADRYGDTSGSVLYVAPCDASVGADMNRVTVRLLALYGPGGVELDDWVDPGPLTRDVRCVADADARVSFDVTVARDAGEGFFDIAVSFEDIFCSAKVDCVDETTGAMLQLVPRGEGERGDSIVIGFACTAGPDASEAAHLYLDYPKLVCADGSATVPLDRVGHVTPITNGVSPLFGAMVFAGQEAIGGALYTNVALGFAGGRDCRLVGRASATSGTFSGLATPADAIWPWVDFDVAITSGTALVCSQHPLDGAAPHDGVATRYTVAGPIMFQHQYPSGSCPPGTTDDPVAGCVDIDECLIGNGGCDPHTTCVNTPGGRICGDCPPDYVGNGADPAGCVRIDPCLVDNGGCDVLTACIATPEGHVCGACPAGYTGDGADGCVDVDECLVGHGGCDYRTTCDNTPGGRACGDCPSGYSGNGADAGGCVDLDECADDNGGCDPRTICVQLSGWALLRQLPERLHRQRR